MIEKGKKERQHAYYYLVIAVNPSRRESSPSEIVQVIEDVYRNGTNKISVT
jgi:hypothetical protein